MPEQIATLYKENIINGNGMYEACDLPDNQFYLSVTDIVNQINLPIKDPGVYKGVMVDGKGRTNFDSSHTIVALHLTAVMLQTM